MSAVIEKGLRIYPSAAIGFVHTIPQGGDTVVGEFLPGGVSSFPYHIRHKVLRKIRLRFQSPCGQQHTAPAISKTHIFSIQTVGSIAKANMQVINSLLAIRSLLDLEDVLDKIQRTWSKDL